MIIRLISSISEYRSRFGFALLLISALSLSGCCTPTICADGTMVDPDAGGEIVERDGKPAVHGGQCIPVA
ncbi:MAG: hypothetical protein ACR2QT_05525 [Woeseiaceae bacterium]